MEAMAKHRTYSIEFKRQVAQEYIAGETLHALAKRHDLSRTLAVERSRRVREQHLDALAIAPGLLEGVSPGECAPAPLGGSFLPFQIYRLAGRRGTE